MRRRRLSLVGLLAAGVSAVGLGGAVADGAGAPARIAGPAGTGFSLRPSVLVPTRDGVALATDIYLPDGAGPFPIILIRTPYNKNAFRPSWVAAPADPAVKPGDASAEAAHARRAVSPVEAYARRGYAVVVQDFRGRWESGGTFRTAKWERRDFEDTIGWLDRQPWSARRVGMWGCSYPGHTQVVAAATGAPSLKAITPMSAAGSFSSGVGQYTMLWHYSGGAREYMNMLQWYSMPGQSNLLLRPDPGMSAIERARFAPLYSPQPRFSVDLAALAPRLPLAGLLDRAGLPPTDWDNVMGNPPESPYWYGDSELLTGDDRLHVPALWIYNWNDIHPSEAIAAFRFARSNGANRLARENQYLVIGPGGHCSFDGGSRQARFGDLALGDTRFDIWRAMLRWNDRWVKDEPRALEGMPRVTYWLYGKNEWRTADDMPVAGTVERSFHLTSGGNANTAGGDGRLVDRPAARRSVDRFVYDPADPVPSDIRDAGEWRVPTTDQRAVERRRDVLVYTSDALAAPLTVVGPMRLVLHVASSAPDTDFTGKLVDVWPDGRAIQVQAGILRARYRNGFRTPTRLAPGKVYEITVDLNATAWWFAPGHRLRLEVSSSDFPRFDRNLNTGGDNYRETRWAVARNQVHAGRQAPSRLILPIAPER